jgi:hypothetical protein
MKKEIYSLFLHHSYHFIVCIVSIVLVLRGGMSYLGSIRYAALSGLGYGFAINPGLSLCFDLGYDMPAFQAWEGIAVFLQLALSAGLCTSEVKIKKR